MSEHRCKDCENSNGNNTCSLTGALHTTGIECPSFRQKEREMFKENDRVKVVADEKRLKELGIPDRCKLTGVEGVVGWVSGDSINIDFDAVYGGNWSFNVGDLELVETPTEAGHAARTFVGHPEGVLEVKDGEYVQCESTASIRTFDSGAKMESYESGATRTKCETKIDPEGFFSPLVILRYSEYMHKCRVQADGTLRDSDNWQGGIPLWRYMKGKWRHFLDTWLMHRGYKKVTDEGLDLQDCLCAELFNTQGYLHELLKAEKSIENTKGAPAPGGAHKNFKDSTVRIEGDN